MNPVTPYFPQGNPKCPPPTAVDYFFMRHQRLARFMYPHKSPYNREHRDKDISKAQQVDQTYLRPAAAISGAGTIIAGILRYLL